jgi:hypothetical protein
MKGILIFCLGVSLLSAGETGKDPETSAIDPFEPVFLEFTGSLEKKDDVKAYE